MKMAIDLSSNNSAYKDLKHHIGHDIVIVGYGDENEPENIAIECESCGEVIADFDAPESEL
jgi:hypothetical protein